MPEVQVLSREVAYDGWIKVEKLELRQQSSQGDWNNPVQREVIRNGDAAAVLLHDVGRGTVLLVRQMRPALVGKDDPWLLEIVAGKVDPGEDPEETGLREVFEEVGHRVQSLHAIGQMYGSPGILEEKVWIYYAQICQDTKVHEGGGDESETLELLEIPVGKLFAMIDRGEVRDAKTLIALQWLRSASL